jgi:TRAP-type mannitol/chloroaromatic compound transport system permease small subunit
VENDRPNVIRALGAIPPGTIKYIAMTLSALGSLIIFGLMILISLDISGRFLLNRPISGVPEIVELAIVMIVFLQLPDSLGANRFVRSDEIHLMISTRSPRLGASLAVFFELTGAILLALLAWGTLPIFYEAWEDNLYAGNPGVFTTPIWPVHLVIVVGSILTSIVFLFAALRRLPALCQRLL